MRILIVCGSYPRNTLTDPVMPAHTGLAQGLLELGHQVMVVTFCDPNEKFASEGTFNVDGVTVHQIRCDLKVYSDWSRGLRTPYFTTFLAKAYLIYAKFKDVVNEFQPDVIDSQEFDGLSFFYAQEHRYPLVIHCYGPVAHLMRAGGIDNVSWIDTELVDLFEMCAVAEADGLIACADDIARRVSANSGRSLSEFHTIRVPLSPADSVPEPIEKRDHAFPRLLFFGRIDKLKGADLLLHAIPLIAKRFPDFKLTMAGGEQGLMGEHIREKLSKQGLRERVEFLGRITRDQVKQNVVDADICIFPSRFETAGYACMESVSYGGAVVASSVGGLPEYHKHGESAWLVAPESSHAIAEGVIHLAENDELRQTLKTKGPEHVLRMCNPRTIAEQTAQVYEHAIAKFETRTTENGSFKVMGRMMQALVEQPEPLVAPVESNNGAPDTAWIVNHLGDMVLGQLSRVWKEGYDAGLEEGMKRAGLANTRVSVGYLMYAAARKLKNKIGKPRRLAGSARKSDSSNS